jgi:voltage-gated potassium channel
VDFIDLATRSEHFDLQIEEIGISGRSALAGSTVKDSLIGERFGVLVVAVKKESGHMVYKPPGDTRLEAGDILIVLGQRQQLDGLEELAGG